MKTVLAVVGLLFVSVLVFAGEETKEPKALTELRQQYQKDLAAAVKPVKEKYMKDLKGIQDGLTKMGMLEEALAVKAEVKALEEELASDKPVNISGKKKFNPTTHNWSWVSGESVIFKSDGTGTLNGVLFKWEAVNENTVNMNWGGRLHILTWAPDRKSYKILTPSGGIAQGTVQK